MRVLLTGRQTAEGKQVIRDLLADDHIIREFGGPLEEGPISRQVRLVDAVVHTDFIDSGSFEARVEHNLQGSIRLAARCEELALPLFVSVEMAWERTVTMARQVLVDEYHAKVVDPRSVAEEIKELVF